jgi:type VI secretion system protein ImpL
VPRIYQDMMTAAEKTSPGIDFNRKYPGSASYVVDGHFVRGAFTSSGFAFMQDAIQHPDRYFQGETWVLGNQAAQSLDAASVSKQLAAQYSSDFIKEWHQFLMEARVVACGGLHEAPGRLNALAGPASPMLALFYTVSHNTAVSDPQIKAIFQPTQAIVDPNAADRFIGPGNTNYVNALLALSGAVGQVAQNPAGLSDPAAGTPIVQAASTADIAARQTAQSFNVDAQFHTEGTVLAIMESPIKCVGSLAEGAGKGGANGAGAKICAALSPLLGKFPFSPNSAAQASVAEVNEVLAPDSGAIWTVYNTSLKPYLVPQGLQYGPMPGAPLQVTPAFAQFFTRQAHISSGLYPAGAKAPALNFTLRAVPSKGIENATLVVDGQRIASGSASQSFTWNAATAQSASLAYNSAEALQFSGPWALFQLIGKAHITRSPGGALLEFPLEVSGVPLKLPDGTPEVVRFELSGPGAEFLLPGGLSGLHCVTPVVK